MAAILVVDDEEPIRFALRQLLESAGHAVEEAEDGKKALGAAKLRDFDLVITDILMPGKDGIEAIMELKKARPRLPVIAISGGGQVGARTYLEMADAFSADRTMAKPIRARDILAAVDELLAPRMPKG